MDRLEVQGYFLIIRTRRLLLNKQYLNKQYQGRLAREVLMALLAFCTVEVGGHYPCRATSSSLLPVCGIMWEAAGAL